MKTILRIVILALLSWPVQVLAQDEDVSDCILASIVLPLLGGQGDSPIVGVRVNGEKAAFYIKPGLFPHSRA
ncbi:hypothetical protein [Gluconobacter sp. P1C6_b]|uniref:hypothetical protein n=1 Tax=Gluconobacter sp. P1C6_b TaxID=2762619 RepID=UPI001C0584F5|nr:hypothetical protein [Gluconobacter sp. P1C6_b]